MPLFHYFLKRHRTRSVIAGLGMAAAKHRDAAAPYTVRKALGMGVERHNRDMPALDVFDVLGA